MSKSTVELDFFRMEKETPAMPLPRKLFDRRRSFRDIQSVISKLDPDLLKTVIASGSVNLSSISSSSSENGNSFATKEAFSVPSTPIDDQTLFPAMPVYTSSVRPSAASEGPPETSPLTIFYNGIVAVFDVNPHKAENILKLAEKGVSKTDELTSSKLHASSGDQRQLLETLNGDLPIARKKSLQRFLEKRKERMTLVSPYGSAPASEMLGQSMS